MSRRLTFWTDEKIKFIRDNFIAVSVPTWVAKADGPEGEFLRSAGVHKQWVTSSGYKTCISASGQPLGRAPCDEVLDAFLKLPESERKPGAVKVRELQPEERLIPDPPRGGLVLRVHARFLAGEDDQLRPAKTTDFPLMQDKPRVQDGWRLFMQPNTEYLWITADEKRSLIPDDPKQGQQIKVRPIIAQRLARFHLTPKRATTSEGGIVRERNVRTAELSLSVKDVSPQRIAMDLTGFIHWGSEFDAAKATTPNGPLSMGYSAPLYGRVDYDRKKQAFTRFDIVAPGHIWGRWGDANGKSMYVERPGKAPFGFALELADGETPTDRIPPGGNSRYIEGRGYFAGGEEILRADVE